MGRQIIYIQNPDDSLTPYFRYGTNCYEEFNFYVCLDEKKCKEWKLPHRIGVNYGYSRNKIVKEFESADELNDWMYDPIEKIREEAKKTKPE